MKNIFAIVLTIFLLPASLWAADFGLLLDQNAAVGGAGSEDAAFNYEAELIPRFSALLGDSGALYLSAAFTFGYENEARYIPELLRTELSWHFNNLRGGDAKLTAGRMQYTAPCAWLAEGLFDGVQFQYNTQAGMFNIGAWYTGLLYKKNANIIISAQDKLAYSADVDYDNFIDTYFASRRIIAALGWEHPAIGELVRTKAALIAQTDLNGNDGYLHSQYMNAKIGITAGSFLLELGGALELAQTADDFNIGLAGELGVFWTLPAAFPSRLSLGGYFSSGKAQNGSIAAFTPIAAPFYGAVLEAWPSGISTISLDYTARLHKTLSLSFASLYFIRGDLGTYTGYPADAADSDGYFLGNEFFARLVWSPVSDLQINLGGGVFLPVMGNAAPDRDPRWSVKLAAILALY